MVPAKADFYTLPKAMYNLDAIKPLLVDGNNAILYKRLSNSMLNMEKIIVSHSLVYVISGRVEIQTYDYESVSLKEGEMLFMPRDSYLISDYVKKDEDMEVYLFFFDHLISSEFLQHIKIPKRERKNMLLKLNLSSNIKTYLNTLNQANYENNAHLLRVKLFELLHLIHESNRDFASLLKETEEKRAKRDIQSYMLEHYDKKLSVNDWASISGLSLSTFNRKFKQNYQLSPKKWILKQNMQLANEALQKGASVSECASEFGYANSSNFIKAFKDIYKKTPKQYILT